MQQHLHQGDQETLTATREALGEGRLLHGLKRRNSTIRLISTSSGLVLEKTYHARFKARDESNAYVAVKRLLTMVGGFRQPLVLSVDDSSNTLRLEYVSLPDLNRAFCQRGVVTFTEQRSRLISLFATASTVQVAFDSDPSNFLVDRCSRELVVIDPLCAATNLPDMTIVVFLLGMIKSFLRCGSIMHVRQYRKVWKDYYIAYLTAKNINYKDLNRQIAAYIDLVISWNAKESHAESYWTRSTRMVFIIPVWRALKFLFTWNIVST